jgi:hypothetical protein
MKTPVRSAKPLPPKTKQWTRNQVGRQVAGVDAIEVKATIADNHIDRALARYQLTLNNDEERFVYFFDTPGLDLLKSGVIARCRRNVGGQHDSTVKFRPVQPGDLAKTWGKLPGFKLEADASETGVVRSASLTMPVEKGLIKRVVADKKAIDLLFTKEQLKFLQSVGKQTVDFKTLTVFGPLAAHRWQFNDPACPWEITAELWRRSDGERLMEFSVKAPADQAAVAIAGFMAFLAEVGAEQDVQQQSKTRWALAIPAKASTPATKTRTTNLKQSAKRKPQTSAQRA